MMRYVFNPLVTITLGACALAINCTVRDATLVQDFDETGGTGTGGTESITGGVPNHGGDGGAAAGGTESGGRGGASDGLGGEDNGGSGGPTNGGDDNPSNGGSGGEGAGPNEGGKGAAGEGGAGGTAVVIPREWTKRVVASEASTVTAAASDLASTLFFIAHRTDGVSLQEFEVGAGSPTTRYTDSVIKPADELAVGGGAVYGMVLPAEVIGSDTLFDASLVRFTENNDYTQLDTLALVGTAAADGDYVYWAGFDDMQTSLIIKRAPHAGDESAVEEVTTLSFSTLPETVEVGVAGGRVYFGSDLAKSGRLRTIDADSDAAAMEVSGLEEIQIREFVAIRPGLLYLLARVSGAVRLYRLEGATLTEIHTAQAEGSGPTLRHLTHADDFVYVLDAPSSIPCVAGEAIYAAAIDGGERAQRAADAQCAQALAAVTGGVYYFDGSKIQEIKVQ